MILRLTIAVPGLVLIWCCGVPLVRIGMALTEGFTR